jgi:hypothetical protein
MWMRVLVALRGRKSERAPMLLRTCGALLLAGSTAVSSFTGKKNQHHEFYFLVFFKKKCADQTQSSLSYSSASKGTLRADLRQKYELVVTKQNKKLLWDSV